MPRKKTAGPAASASPAPSATRTARFDSEQRVVAVTGVCSFVGGELCKRLEEDRRYYKVLAIDIRKPPFPLQKTQFCKVDLTLPAADADLAAILSREGVETFVHAAFLSKPTHQSA